MPEQPLLIRIPEPSEKPHRPIRPLRDPAVLRRTLDGLRALRWEPNSMFTGRSVTDVEACREPREWWEM